MQNYLQNLDSDDLKRQLTLLIQNRDIFDGKSFIAKLNEILAQQLKNIGVEESSLSIADLCFLPINENNEFDSIRPISADQKIQLEDILSQFIDNNPSALSSDGRVRLNDGQEFVLGELLTSEKINGQPFLSFAMLSGNAPNPDPTIADINTQQNYFAQKLFEETFDFCEKNFDELTPGQQEIFKDAITQASDDLITKASMYSRLDTNSLQKISLRQLSDLAEQINKTFEESFHQLAITTTDPHCQDPDKFRLGYSQNFSLSDRNFLINKSQSDLVTGFWQKYLGNFLASQNIQSSGLLKSSTNSSIQDLLKLFQGALAEKLPLNEIKEPDKYCFLTTQSDLVESVVKYVNLTKADDALQDQCDKKTQPQQNFSNRLENAIQVEVISSLFSEISRFVALNSKAFKKIPKHHQQNIFSTIDIATRFAVIAILANQDKLSTIASLSVASASSISLKKITAMSFEKLQRHSNIVRKLGEKFSSIPQPSKAFMETGALVALYQGFNQLLFREQESDKSQSQQFAESMTIIACTSLVAGITRGLLRYLSHNIQQKIDLRSGILPQFELVQTNLNSSDDITRPSILTAPQNTRLTFPQLNTIRTDIRTDDLASPLLPTSPKRQIQQTP